MQRVIIIEDELHAGERLKRMLESQVDHIEVLCILESIDEATQWLSNNSQPDLAFFDIQLSDGLSFEIFDRVVVECPIIFTTAYDQYAIKAFEVNSVDYLLKPIDKDDLERAIEKYQSHFQKQGDTINYAELAGMLKKVTSQYKSRFLVSKGASLIPIGVEDIAYFNTHDSLVYLNTFQGKRYVVSHRLDELEGTLDPKLFFRANRQFITHHQSVTKVHPFFNGKLRIELIPANQDEVVVSRLKAAQFKEWLGE